MQKRGQVTIYIILGIVVLVAFGLLISLQFDLFKSEFEKELEVNVVPLQLMPVKSYMDTCISDVIDDVVFTLSSRGGYLNLPEDILPRSINNPFSNSLELYPGSEVAYWFYESANGLQKEQVPSLDSMELEIENYISNEFSSCYPDLSFYENEGFEITLPNYVSPNINIETNHIEVIINAPTNIKLDQVSKELQKYVLKIDIPLGKFYEKSKEIFLEESENNFIEEITIDVLAAYEEIPYNGIELYCGRKTWSKSEVKEKMKEYLSANIGALRLKGVDYPKSKDPYDYFSVNVNTPEDVTSNFLYSSSWPFAMEVTPSQGDFLFSDSLTQSNADLSKLMNLFFCMNNYNFVYDIKYPVLVSLMDESGYVFQYATMAIIDNNQAKRSEYEFFDFSESVEMQENICNYLSSRISVEAYDFERMKLLPDTDISYQCSVVTCYLGKTNSGGMFEGNAPTCLNGNVIAQKEGYHPGEVQVSTNEENMAVIMLYPYTELEIEIKILDLETGEVKNLEEDQHVSFQFIGDYGDYIVMASDETETIQLIPGYYQITSYVYGTPDSNINVQGGTHIECVDVPREGILGLFLNEEKCFDVEFDDIEIESVIIGGANFEWNIQSLINYDKIILYGVINGIPEEISDITDVFNNIELNHLNSRFMEPKLL
jgi:hypothetical protein